MKDNFNTYEDDFLRKIIQQFPEEKPGNEFISGLMKKIEKLPAKESLSLKSEPIISVKGWIIIALIIILLIVASFTQLSNYSLSWISINLNWFNTLDTLKIPLKLPDTFVFGIELFVVLSLIRIIQLTGLIKKTRPNKF